MLRDATGQPIDPALVRTDRLGPSATDDTAALPAIDTSMLPAPSARTPRRPAAADLPAPVARRAAEESTAVTAAVPGIPASFEATAAATAAVPDVPASFEATAASVAVGPAVASPGPAPAPAKARPGSAVGAAQKAAYCCAVDRYRLTFARALSERGFTAMDYDYRLDRALQRLAEGGGYGVLMLHGNLPDETIDEALIQRIRTRTATPLLLIGYPTGSIDTSKFADVDILPPPVTVMGMADAAEKLRPNPQSGLVRRLMGLPGIARHGVDAVAYLVDRADPTPLYPQQVLYRQDEPADAMFFVLAGGVMLSQDDQEVDGVGMGFVLGESAILEDGRRRATDATAREATVLLRIPRAAVDEGPASFRALIFELIARTLAPRARSAR